MKTLGVDYGLVRMGLAFSDEDGALAFPLETVENHRAIQRIREVVNEKKVTRIVVGMPRNMDGSMGTQAEQVQKFVDLLRSNLKVEVMTWDERLTTQGVERLLVEANVPRRKRKKIIDQLAAQSILQSYLDAHGSL